MEKLLRQILDLVALQHEQIKSLSAAVEQSQEHVLGKDAARRVREPRKPERRLN